MNTHTGGTGLWRENCKTWEKRHTHCRTQNKANKKQKNKQQQQQQQQKQLKRGKLKMHNVGLGIWREYCKTWKMRKTHFKTWNMGRDNENRGK